MSAPEAIPVRVTLAEQGVVAVMAMAPRLGSEELTFEAVRANVLASGVILRRLDEDAIRDALERYDAEEGLGGVVVARGEPPRPARAGAFELDPALRQRLDVAEGRATPETTTEVDEPDTDQDRVSHYERSAFVIVRPGETLGVLRPPDPGMDGEDVTGGTIPAPVPNEPSYEPDDTIEVTDDRRLLARNAGRLEVGSHTLRVLPRLDIEASVDFSTGHIDFPGDVRVAGGVRDRFEVHAGGALEIHELVEAAHLRSQGPTALHAGMAGRGRGTVRARGDLEARYLDAAIATVGGDVRVEREITNTRLIVLGHIDAAACSLIGGDTNVARSVHVHTLGAASGAQTRVRLGARGDLESVADETVVLLEEVVTTVVSTGKRLLALQSLGSRMSHSEAEEMTEAQFEVAEAESKRDQVRGALERLVTLHASATEVSLRVESVLHAGVTLEAGGVSARIRSDIRGPLLITLDDAGALQLEDLSTRAQTPLARLAEIGEAEEAAGLVEAQRICSRKGPDASPEARAA